MGKILDTITVFFKGDTSDLAQKKKEAEQIVDETVANIDKIKQAVSAVNVAVTEVNTAAQATIVGEEARKKVDDVNKKLGTTKKGALEVEDALKKVVGQFTKVAFGAFSVSSAVSAFKNSAQATIDLAQFSKNTGGDIKTINALGNALKTVGGDAAELQANLEGLAKAQGGTISTAINTLPAISSTIQNTTRAGGNQIGESLGLTPNFIQLLRDPTLFSEQIPRLAALGDQLDSIGPKALELRKAWAGLTTEFQTSAFNLEDKLFPKLTKLLDFLGKVIDALNKIQTTDITPQNAIKTGEQVFIDFAEGAKKVFPQLLSDLSGVASSIFGNSHPLGRGAVATTHNNNTSVRIGEVNVNAPQAVDATGISKSLAASIDREINQVIQHYNDGTYA